VAHGDSLATRADTAATYRDDRRQAAFSTRRCQSDANGRMHGFQLWPICRSPQMTDRVPGLLQRHPEVTETTALTPAYLRRVLGKRGPVEASQLSELAARYVNSGAAL